MVALELPERFQVLDEERSVASFSDPYRQRDDQVCVGRCSEGRRIKRALAKYFMVYDSI